VCDKVSRPILALTDNIRLSYGQIFGFTCYIARIFFTSWVVSVFPPIPSFHFDFLNNHHCLLTQVFALDRYQSVCNLLDYLLLFLVRETPSITLMVASGIVVTSFPVGQIGLSFLLSRYRFVSQQINRVDAVVFEGKLCILIQLLIVIYKVALVEQN